MWSSYSDTLGHYSIHIMIRVELPNSRPLLIRQSQTIYQPVCLPHTIKIPNSKQKKHPLKLYLAIVIVAEAEAF